MKLLQIALPVAVGLALASGSLRAQGAGQEQRAPEALAKQRRVSTKVLGSRKRRWSKYRKELFQHLRALSREMKQNSRGKSPLKQRVCRVCNKRWPAMSPFFLVYEKVTSNGHRSYTGRLCRLCSNRRRRGSRRRRHRQP